MLLSYFRLAIRILFKNKLAFMINLMGMSIALGCCITAYVNYEYSATFDELQKNAGQLYRIGFWEEGAKGKIPYGVAPMPVGNLVRANLGEGDQVIQYISKDASFRIGDEMFQKQFVYAEPFFTKIFSIDLLSGTASLQDKSKVLISDKLALTYYGQTNVVGKPLTQVISGEPREFEIGGVYKAFPFNSSFTFDLLTSYDNYFIDSNQKSTLENDWSRWATTFLYLKDPTSINAITKQLSQYIEPQNNARQDIKAASFYVESFKGMSARALREKNQGHWMNMPIPPAAVIAPFAMASLLLLVACFNFMNNAIAVAGNRLKEIGIRKVIGGRRTELVFQFLTEALIFCLLSLLAAMVLAEYFTSGWNAMWNGIEMQISYADNIKLLVVLALLIAFTTLLAGGYAAFYISSYKPIQILRGTTKLGGGNVLTRSLLVFQFSISLAAVIFALAFYFNSKFQKEYDLGYNYQSVIQVPLDNPKQYDQLKNELMSNPLIKSVGGSQHHIYTSSYKGAARADNRKEMEVDMLNIGNDYFDALNVRIIAGRPFEQNSVSDDKESIIVNEEFLRKFDLKDAVGQRITLNDTSHVYIVGVVKDVYLRALFEPLSPLVFRYTPPANYKFLVASTTTTQLVEANNQMKETWKKLFPNSLYTGRLMEQKMAMVMEHFDSVVILYTFLGIVAIIMSVSGLYSLVSLNLQKRTKEFGIRKILGAPIPHITFQASKQFLIIMAISFVIGSLMGSVMVNGMMSSVWEYYEAANVQVLGIAITILFAIAISTIGFKILSVTRANPVDSLRYE